MATVAVCWELQRDMEYILTSRRPPLTAQALPVQLLLRAYPYPCPMGKLEGDPGQSQDQDKKWSVENASNTWQVTQGTKPSLVTHVNVCSQSLIFNPRLQIKVLIFYLQKCHGRVTCTTQSLQLGLTSCFQSVMVVPCCSQDKALLFLSVHLTSITICHRSVHNDRSVALSMICPVHLSMICLSIVNVLFHVSLII